MAQEIIYCSKCGTQNLANASFCRQCGASLGPVAVAMGSPVAAGYPSAVPAVNAAYGGFWIRFVAIIIDGLIVGAVISPALFATRTGPLDFSLHPGFRPLSTVVSWLYEALLLSSPWQATVGKKLLGLRVTDEAGQRISFGRATGRHFAKYLSLITCFIGFIMAAFTHRKRALHDMIAGTLVMKERM
jgi:uncharacterized RDD family membrane protein YckC